MRNISCDIILFRQSYTLILTFTSFISIIFFIILSCSSETIFSCNFDSTLMFQFPHIKRAMELSPVEILFFGSPWAPPAWMKTNGMFNGTGELLPEMWQPWANYFVK